MQNVNEVIKGLECCLPMTTKDGWGDCKNCPYDRPVTLEDGICKCCHELMSDALALLKLQRPRLMTFEQVRAAYENPMWFESKGTFRGQKGFWVLSKGVSPSFHIRLIPAFGADDTELSMSVYGSVWRCWTSKPTLEQMEATPWN